MIPRTPIEYANWLFVNWKDYTKLDNSQRFEEGNFPQIVQDYCDEMFSENEYDDFETEWNMLIDDDRSGDDYYES